MREFLALGALALTLILAAIDAIWPARPPLLIDASAAAAPGIWPRGASAPAGGEWCDVKPDPPARPRGKYDYRPGYRPNDLGIA